MLFFVYFRVFELSIGDCYVFHLLFHLHLLLVFHIALMLIESNTLKLIQYTFSPYILVICVYRCCRLSPPSRVLQVVGRKVPRYHRKPVFVICMLLLCCHMIFACFVCH